MSKINHQITGARETLILKDGDSFIEFLMSPMSDIDISEIDLWVQARYVALASASDRDKAKQEAQTLTAFAGIGAEVLSCVAGITRLLWQAIHRNHPNVSQDKLYALMMIEENQVAVNDKFQSLNYVERFSKKSDNGHTATPDKATIYRRLAKMYGWTFADIAAMTPLQQLTALTEINSANESLHFETEEQLAEWKARRSG